jgi:hypothetical protein
LHGTALGDHVVEWNADGGGRRLQRFAGPLDEGAAFLRRHHAGRQTSIADTVHHPDPANADRIGRPVAENGVRPRRLRIDTGVAPVEQRLCTAKNPHDTGLGVVAAGPARILERASASARPIEVLHVRTALEAPGASRHAPAARGGAVDGAVRAVA